MIQPDPEIPPYTLDALEDWAIEGHMPGGFLQAFLRNDLKRALNRADDNNFPAIGTLHAFVYNYAPASCWGSEDAVESWASKGGLRHTAPDAIDGVREQFEQYRQQNYDTATA
jgi:hypothetical protein